MVIVATSVHILPKSVDVLKSSFNIKSLPVPVQRAWVELASSTDVKCINSLTALLTSASSLQSNLWHKLSVPPKAAVVFQPQRASPPAPPDVPGVFHQLQQPM